MIKVEKFEKDGNEGRDCTISGSNIEIGYDLDALFTALSRNPIVELLLVQRMHDYITSKAMEISKEKGDK